MATRKAGGTAKNLRDSNPKYLGIKLYDGEVAKPGDILVRQRGTRILPGNNVRLGSDHTIYSLKNGTVKYSKKRKINFDNKISVKKVANVN